MGTEVLPLPGLKRPDRDDYHPLKPSESSKPGTQRDESEAKKPSGVVTGARGLALPIEPI
jgi:hypothetical protein